MKQVYSNIVCEEDCGDGAIPQSRPYEKWWFDLDSKLFYIGEYAKVVFNFSSTVIGADEYAARIHENYRDKVISNIFTRAKDIDYHITYPLLSPLGYVWVEIMSRNDGDDFPVGVEPETMPRVLRGEIGFLSDLNSEEYIRQHLNFYFESIMSRQRGISQSLLSFLEHKDTQQSIHNTLENILNEFNGDRAYIFEYNMQTGTQSCTYEVVSDNCTSEIESLQDIPISYVPWWNDHIFGCKSIIIDDVSAMPDEAVSEREMLVRQNIKSILVVPLLSGGSAWGYIGIDIINNYRKWNKIDVEWFMSLANILSLCIKLRELENAAISERQFLKDLYRNMPMGYMRVELLHDKQGCVNDYRMQWMNNESARILGFQREEHIGRKGSEYDTFIMAYLPDFERIEKEGVTSERELYIPNIDRYIRTVSYTPKRNEVISLFFDITDNIRVREALMSSQEKLSKIYNNIPVGLEIYDKDGYLLDVNDMEMEIFGLGSKEQVIGLNMFTNPNLPSDQLERLRNGEEVSFELLYDFSKARDGYFDSRLKGVKHLTCKCTTLHDADNNIENYLLIMIDNTETYNAYNAIRESDSVFEYLGEFAGIGYLKWDLLANEGYAFDQWYVNFGQQRSEDFDVVGDYPNMHPDDAAAIKQFYADAVAGRATEFQRDIRIRNGSAWNCSRCNIKVKSYNPNNNSIVVFGVSVDISELKHTQDNLIKAKVKAEESDRLKSAFLANMSHEIRTPLNAIVGFSNIIADMSSEPEMKEYVSIIMQNNDLLLQLISDILDISKIESGAFEIAEQCFDVNELCRDVSAMGRLKVAGGVEIVCITPEQECVIVSDRNKLHQVLSNFVNNSVKFTKQGRITIGYNVMDGKIEFYVSDTGVGISKENRTRVFERFVKLDSFVSGTGLGLPICKSIVERLGGTIGVESELDKGSYFYFVFPLDVIK